MHGSAGKFDPIHIVCRVCWAGVLDITGLNQKIKESFFLHPYIL